MLFGRDKYADREEHLDHLLERLDDLYESWDRIMAEKVAEVEAKNPVEFEQRLSRLERVLANELRALA
jgi:hypothetical protein